MFLLRAFKQEQDEYCGPAVVQTLLKHYGLPFPSQRSLAEELGTNFRFGTSPEKIQDFFRNRGIPCSLHTNCSIKNLKDALLAGYKPIVLWQDWGGHLCIATEWNDVSVGFSGGVLTLADPASYFEGRQGTTDVALDRFRDMWYDFPEADPRFDGLMICAKPKEASASAAV